ncbi:hypothetical protein H5P28_15310, partial [Ruficoccus amylovorans]
MWPNLILVLLTVGVAVACQCGPPPASPPPVDFGPLAGALRVLGGSSVLCSLIWGASLITQAKLKQKDNREPDPATAARRTELLHPR